MEVLLGIGMLFALWAYVRWDQAQLKRRNPKPLSREQLSRGFKPGQDVKRLGSLAGALLCFFSAIFELVTPKSPPFDGRFAVVRETLFAQFGSFGSPALLLVLCFIFLWFAWRGS